MGNVFIIVYCSTEHKKINYFRKNIIFDEIIYNLILIIDTQKKITTIVRYIYLSFGSPVN